MRAKAVELTCNSVQDLNYHFATIEEHLALPESEETWDKLASAVTGLKSLSDNGATEFPSELISLIRGVARPLINCINSERSKLSGVSLELFISLAQLLQSSFAPLIPVFIPTLLSQCMRSNKVFSARGKACIIEIIGSTRLPGILAYILHSVKDKSVAMRLAAAEAALACLNTCDPEELVKGVRQGEIESIIKATIQDPNGDIRKTSRKMFEAYTILNPDRIDTFVQPLSPTAKKYLNIKPKEQPHSSRNPQSRVAVAPSRSTRPVPSTQPSAKPISKPALHSLPSHFIRPTSALSQHSTHSINALSTTSARINAMSQTRVKVAAQPGPGRIMHQPPPRSGGITRVQPGVISVPGDVPQMRTGPRRITIVPAPLPKEIPPSKPQIPVQTSSVTERPKSRVATKITHVVSSQPGPKVPSRPPSATEGSRKELEVPKPASTRYQSQTRTTKPSQPEKAREVPPQSRARTTSNARPPSRMDLSKSTRPPSRMDLFKPTRPPSRADLAKSTRTGAVTKTKVVDKRKRPEPQPTILKDFEETNPAVSVPLPPSPVLPLAATTESLPSLKLETEVEFVPPVTASPKKATAETKVVHALKTGLPLLGTPPRSPLPSARVEGAVSRIPTPEPAGVPEKPAVVPTQEPVQVQGQVAQVAEQRDSDPDPVPVTKEPTKPSPVLVHPVAEPHMPPRAAKKEGANKVGNLVAHFEDPSRHKPARPPRMVEQTPISALVSTIRKGFEDMKPLPALGMVEEGDSVDVAPPPRLVGGLRIGGVKGLNIRSRSGLGERTALTTVQLNS